MKNQGVCIIIETFEHEIIAVSRKYNFNDLGLPGGKIEEGESKEEAIVREVMEEVGIVINQDDLVFVYSGLVFPLSNDNSVHNVQSTCYCLGGYDYASRYSITNIIKNNNIIEGEVVLTTREKILNGTFGDYNRRAFESYDILRKQKLKEKEFLSTFWKYLIEFKKNTSLSEEDFRKSLKELLKEAKQSGYKPPTFF